MTVTQDALLSEVLKQEHRAAPQELWGLMRREPVSRMSDGSWVVSSYAAVRDLIAHPSLAVEAHRAGHGPGAADTLSRQDGVAAPFIQSDPPEHERVRRLFMRHFGPPVEPGRVLSLEPAALQLVTEALDACAARTRMDVVADYTYRLPVSIICELFGVPADDRDQLHAWSVALASDQVPAEAKTDELRAEVGAAAAAFSGYLMELLQRRRTEPGEDMLSRMVHDAAAPSRISDADVVNNAIIILVGGHGTTTSGTASTILTLLRNPEALAEVRDDPALIPQAFEEVLRLEPPVQYRDRVALADITWGGTTIPKDSFVRIAIAAANRDPERFPDPDRFDVHRQDVQHLSFYGGAHYCFGAPLARMESRIMIGEWLRRVQGPRLVADPPEYDANPVLRGPSSVLVDHDGITG